MCETTIITEAAGNSAEITVKTCAGSAGCSGNCRMTAISAAIANAGLNGDKSNIISTPTPTGSS